MSGDLYNETMCLKRKTYYVEVEVPVVQADDGESIPDDGENIPDDSGSESSDESQDPNGDESDDS